MFTSPISFQDHLSENLSADGFASDMVVDFSKIFMMAHSSGGHVVVNYLKVGNPTALLFDPRSI
jgi:alpha-beta hydrolase superfamily lysophospholipase